jgi:predicted negative regulator of RcsB-dependent stress response
LSFSSTRCRRLYESLQQSCRDAVHRGALSRARSLSVRAERVAEASGDPDLRHQAATNRSMVLLELGDVAAAEQGLREVVLASSDDEVICRAAFYLASSLRRQKRLGRARFFARSARERAERLRDPLWQARCQNLLGNIELNRGDTSAAREAYSRALALWSATPGDHRFALAIVLDNIGYGLTLEKREREGLPYLARALALALEIGDLRTEAECRQDLAHALLGMGSVQASRGNAMAALALAEDNGYRDIRQNCTYILGELAALEGDEAERDRWFDRLQEMFPHVPHLREFLGLFDVCDLLTFH